MTPIHDYECSAGHQTERATAYDKDFIRCPICRRKAGRIWLSRSSSHRSMEPIVIDKLPDGSFSFPGRTDAHRPKGAERIEIRNFVEYSREMKTVNRYFKAKASRENEKLHRSHEIGLNDGRSDIITRMGQTNDPVIKNIYRETLEHYNTDRPKSGFGEIYSEAMERNSSNREAYHRPGETGLRGRK